METEIITILNTSILTDYGVYEYSMATLQQVKTLLLNNKYQSAVGHNATADILTELLGVNVPMNRMEYKQGVGDAAVVFKLKRRVPEGIILTREQIEEHGYEFGYLYRKA